MTLQPVAKAPLHSSGDASRLDSVAPRSNVSNVLHRRALPSGRFPALGATRRFITDCLALAAAERGLLPDGLIRLGIRSLLRGRLALESRCAAGGLERALDARLLQMRQSPIAVSPAAANDQQYETPAEFFRLVLGPRLKYSAGLWPDGVTTLAGAESAMLETTAERAGIEDGMRVLDLGCGWGALSLWMAERFPRAQITAVSNSTGQARHIMAQQELLGLGNLRVVTADMNHFQPSSLFERIVSVEMFEHMRNYERLLGRIASWLHPGGALFVHLFCHRFYSYLFEVGDGADWMARHFFTGGMMPSVDLLLRCAGPLELVRQWKVGGRDYERTLRAWLANLDARRDEVEQVLGAGEAPGAGRLRVGRWRLFLLACAELFGYRAGREWFVAHYLLRPGRTGSVVPGVAEQRG